MVMSSKVDPMNVTPMHGFVLVEYDPVPEETEGGLVMVPEFRERRRLRIATVKKLGYNLVTKKGAVVPHGVKVGDRVVTDRIYGSVVDEDNRDIRLLSEDQIIAVIEGDESGLDIINTVDNSLFIQR
jgi:co-chaperonin GroES (HSP10)